jgi:alkylation response protein AidB-like acyl-CoA dehydrogenase
MSSGAKIMPGAARLGDRSYFRLTLAKGEAQLLSVRAFFYEAIEAAWEQLLAGDPLSAQQTNRLRLAATHAAHSCADIVQAAYRAAGISAIQKSHRMQHILRDAMVVTQHASLSEATYDDIGGFLAGSGAGL